MSKTAEKASAASLVTHREFKLLLKPEKFPNRRALLEFNELLARIAQRSWACTTSRSSRSTRSCGSCSSTIRRAKICARTS